MCRVSWKNKATGNRAPLGGDEESAASHTRYVKHSVRNLGVYSNHDSGTSRRSQLFPLVLVASDKMAWQFFDETGPFLSAGVFAFVTSSLELASGRHLNIIGAFPISDGVAPCFIGT